MENNTKRNYCVYVHTNKINGKRYVGITSQKPKYRWNSGYGYIECPVFYNAIQHYGWGNFSHEILEDKLTCEEAEQKEIYYIAKFKTLDRNFGYNLSSGGDCSSMEWTEDMRKRQSDIMKIIMSDPKRKSDVSARTKKLFPNGPFYGRKHTDEAKRKMSEYRSSEKWWTNGKTGWDAVHVRAIDQYDIHHNFIKTWPSFAEVERQMGISRFLVRGSCANGDPNIAGGFYWGYHGSEPLWGVEKVAKPVAQIDKDTGKVINIFWSINEAKKKTGADRATIIKHCTNPDVGCQTYRWRYIDAHVVAGHIIDKRTFQEVGIAEASNLLILPEEINKQTNKENING